MHDPKTKTILIVDDDQSITAIFEFILQQVGYKTLTASTGEAGVNLVKAHPEIDLVFLDLKMPVMSGIESLKVIQQFRPELIVVMMTGYSVDDLLKEAFDLGVYSVIYKPFDVEEVMGIVDKVFQTSPSL